MAKVSQAVKDQEALGLITERQIVCTELGAELQKLALKELEGMEA